MIKDRTSSNTYQPSPTSSARSSTRSSATSNASTASSRTSISSGDTTESKGAAFQAAKLIAQGVGNVMGGAFLQKASQKISSSMAGVSLGSKGNKLFDDTKTGKRVSLLEDKGEAQKSLGTSQIKLGLSKMMGKGGERHQQGIAHAKAEKDAANAKRKAIAVERQTNREIERAANQNRSARAIRKHEEY